MDACTAFHDGLQQQKPVKPAPHFTMTASIFTAPRMLLWCGMFLIALYAVPLLAWKPEKTTEKTKKHGDKKYHIATQPTRQAVAAKQGNKRGVRQGAEPATQQSAKQDVKKHSRQQSPQRQNSSDLQPSITAQQQKLRRLQEQIEQDRERLKSVREHEGTVSGKLSKQRQKSKEVQTSIQILTQQMRRTQDSILKTTTNLGGLQQRLRMLEREYARVCRRVVRRGEPSLAECMTLGFAPDSELATGAVLRSLNRVSMRRKAELREIMDSLSGRKSTLEILLSRHETLMSSEEQRAKRIGQAIEFSEKALDSIRSNKKLLQQKLEERNASIRKMQQVIADLVTQEIRRKKEEARRRAAAELRTKKGGTAATKRKHSSSDDVEEASATPEFQGVLAGKFRPHSLPWPTPSHKILHSFGQYTNPMTGTVMHNPGIGIEAAYGTLVQCVAEGMVSLIHWLPGYGSLVIVDHGNDFRTVYANLSSVAVREGARVSAGTLVGKSGRSVDGEYAHFEVWRNREKLNPVTWLR